jgi:hypothetical protein
LGRLEKIDETAVVNRLLKQGLKLKQQFSLTVVTRPIRGRSG